MIDFFMDNPQVKAINTKYSVPGHSCVQLVDNAHSLIEKAMSKTEVYSPVGLVHLLKKVSVNKHFRVIQMKSEDFGDYGSVAKQINYKNVPFSKISTIMFTQTFHEVKYKTSHKPDSYVTINLKFNEKPARKAKETAAMSKKSVVPGGLQIAFLKLNLKLLRKKLS